MIRTLALTLAAALFATVPAHAAEMRVSLVGKTPEQVNADLRRAVQIVCSRETALETFRLEAFSRCYRLTLKATLDKVGDPRLFAMNPTVLARR